MYQYHINVNCNDTQIKKIRSQNSRRGRQYTIKRETCILLLTNSSLKRCAWSNAMLAWTTIWSRRSRSSNWAMSGLEPFDRNLVETPQGFTHFISSVLFGEFIIGALRTDSTSRITNALPNPGNKNSHFRFLALNGPYYIQYNEIIDHNVEFAFILRY